MLRTLFMVFIATVTVPAPIIYAGPQLLSDLKVGDQWALAPDLSIKESKCTSYYFVVSTCYLDYVDRRDPARVGGTLNYFVLGSWAGERALLLRSSRDPNRIGSTIGLEHMRQRLVSFGVAILIALGFLSVMIKAFVLLAREDEPTTPDRRSEPTATADQAPAGRTFGQRAVRSA